MRILENEVFLSLPPYFVPVGFFMRVEVDKAWETSWTRRILVAVITYLLIVIFMFVTELEKPFIGAIIPTVAYLLSMSTLPYFKKRWINKKMNK